MHYKKVTLQFNEKEQALLKEYMTSQTRPLPTILKDLLFEDIEDFLDSLVSEEAIAYNLKHPKTYTSFEMLEILCSSKNN